MKILTDILKNIAVQQCIGDSSLCVHQLHIDSRKVEEGDCFVAIRGTLNDGHQFIDSCIVNGAKVIVCETLPVSLDKAVTYVQVENAAAILGFLAANFYDQPSKRIKVVGVTGTNGKTSIVTLLFRLFRSLGYNVGLLSTVQNQINETVIPSTHTTPDAISLNKLMNDMVDEDCEYCFMEVSSHAIEQYRIAGLQFTGAVFSNITHDHLDYHKTFENYIKAKKKFFDGLPNTAFALTNADDRNGAVMLQNTKAKKYTYAIKSIANFKTKVLENSIAGLHLEIDGVELFTRLIGDFNAYNLTAVYATALLLEVEKEACLISLSSLQPPSGRFEQISSPMSSKLGIVDYAHTPDALKNVLQTIAEFSKGNEQVITVVGCGGDRDKAKRPVMAEIATRYSDRVIFTSDNPRSEDPEEILKQMNAGVSPTEKRKVLTIADRREAIKTAVLLAQKGDLILIAGKGHETYQEINGVKAHFDDKEELEKCFALYA
jgi:UDP-N-acetylmuramoyl-L-alanyl-D-glutamate--2,6-diaminopimelate ligase